jgi:hypothetical protein
MKIVLLVAALALAGCASTGVVSMGSGMYLVSKRSPQVGFGPPVAAKADVYKQASEFCTKQDGTVETVDFQGTNSGFAKPASAQLQFKCVKQP